MFSSIQNFLFALFSSQRAAPIDNEHERFQNHIKEFKRRTLVNLAQHSDSSFVDRSSGTWGCHKCTHINKIIILPGDHPLGYVTCGECGHILCGRCLISAPIEPWEIAGIDFRSDEVGSGDLPIAHVCTTCGLSHRAVVATNTRIDGRIEMIRWKPFEECICGMRVSFWKKCKWDAYLLGGGKGRSRHGPEENPFLLEPCKEVLT